MRSCIPTINPTFQAEIHLLKCIQTFGLVLIYSLLYLYYVEAHKMIQHFPIIIYQERQTMCFYLLSCNSKRELLLFFYLNTEFYKFHRFVYKILINA